MGQKRLKWDKDQKGWVDERRLGRTTDTKHISNK